MGWKVTARFMVDAATEGEAGSIVTETIRAMDVAVARSTFTPAAGDGTPGRWEAAVELDLSGLPMISPDDAATRGKYVTRNLGVGVAWRVHTATPGHDVRSWARSDAPARTGVREAAPNPTAGPIGHPIGDPIGDPAHDPALHPAIRAMTIETAASD